jgi:hypothetical protein
MSRNYWNFDSYSEEWPKGEEKLFVLKGQINEYKTQKRKNNYKLISKEVNKDAGCYVNIYGHKGILCTAVIDIDDFYYVVMDENRELVYHSCCGGYKVIPPDEELSANFSVLNWLREHEPESLLKIVNESLEKNEVIPISVIRVVETG